MAKEKNDTAVSNEKIIAALMNSSTLAQAAQAAGISSRALYDRMGNADFRAEYRTAKAAIMRQATQTLNSRIAGAVDTIAEIMQDVDANPAIRLQAAQTILSQAAKFSERLDAVDTKAEEMRRGLFDPY